MAMGRRKRHRQQTMWLTREQLPRTAGHVFYDRVNKILAEHSFDDFAEKACQQFYAETMGRPGIAPGIYFRMQLIGYFEGIDSERGMAWRCCDSLSLREFIEVGLAETVPDHSSVSRTRRLIDLETHGSVFSWMLRVLAESRLVDGKTVGVDASTLEANAAMRSIVRRDTGASYTEFLEGLAKASGIETPTRADLAQLDRKRPNKGSNEDWVSGRSRCGNHQDEGWPDAPGAQSRTRCGYEDWGGLGCDGTSGRPWRHDNPDRDTDRVGRANGDSRIDRRHPRGSVDRAGDRQGLPKQRHGNNASRCRSTNLHVRAGSGPPPMEEQSRRTKGRLCEPAKDSRKPRQTTPAAAWSDAGTAIRSLPGNRWTPSCSPARPIQHSQAGAGSLRRVQSESGSTPADRKRNATGSPGPRDAALFRLSVVDSQSGSGTTMSRRVVTVCQFPERSFSD